MFTVFHLPILLLYLRYIQTDCTLVTFPGIFQELPLAHVVHNMRNIDYEISVYSDLSSAVLGYRLVFLAESGDGHNYELVREIYMYGTCWWYS